MKQVYKEPEFIICECEQDIICESQPINPEPDWWNPPVTTSF